jgi:hypothetical protein
MLNRQHVCQMISPAWYALILAACGASADASPTWPVSPTNTPQPTPPVLAHNPLDTEPCMAPCWQSIIPGETTLDQAAQILIDENGLGDECIPANSYIVCDGTVLYADETGKIEFIKIWPSKNVTLSEVAALYGEPDTLYFCHDIDELHDISHTHTVAYFASSKLWLYFDEPGYPVEIVHPNMVVRDMAFGPKEWDWTLWGCEAYQTTPWHGYGSYDE